MTNQNVTYFESPSFPHASRDNLGSCQLTILLARNVKQVLLEFLFFELLPPNIDGDCIDDRFIVSGQTYSNEIPVICGVNSGQHSRNSIEVKLNAWLTCFLLVFIEVEGSDKLHLTVLTTSASDRAFKIKVTQLRESMAPSFCLQFHTNPTGIIKSFNYDENSQILKLRRPSYLVR